MHFYQPWRELRICQCHDIRILDLIFESVLKIQGVMKLWNKVWRLLLPQLPPHLQMSTLTTPAIAMVQSRRKLNTLCLTLLHRIINNKLDEQYYCTIWITLSSSISKCIRCILMSDMYFHCKHFKIPEAKINYRKVYWVAREGTMSNR